MSQASSTRRGKLTFIRYGLPTEGSLFPLPTHTWTRRSRSQTGRIDLIGTRIPYESPDSLILGEIVFPCLTFPAFRTGGGSCYPNFSVYVVVYSVYSSSNSFVFDSLGRYFSVFSSSIC